MVALLVPNRAKPVLAPATSNVYGPMSTRWAISYCSVLPHAIDIIAVQANAATLAARLTQITVGIAGVARSLYSVRAMIRYHLLALFPRVGIRRLDEQVTQAPL